MEDFSYLIGLIQNYGYLVIGIGILLECMGIPMPGETVLVLGGVAASMGHLNLIAVIVIAIVAAVVGDNFGYMIGKKYGRKIIKKYEHFPLFHYKHISKAEGFFKKHGNKTVFIGRFTAILRTYSALFAGILDMHYPTFFFYNLSGGVIWATIFGILGYIVGNNLPVLGSMLIELNVVVLGVVVIFLAYKTTKLFLRKRREKKEEK